MDSTWYPLQQIDTEYSADSVEWCPHQAFDDVVVCGTYQLAQNDGGTNSRLGRVLLYQLQDDQYWIEHSRINTPAILDMKWCCQQNLPVIALADAAGCASLYSIADDEGKIGLNLLNSCCFDSSALALSLDWSSRCNADRLAVSDSTGKLNIFQAGSGSSLTADRRWLAHDYEAWIIAFDRWNDNIVYSGGDDCKLKGWDLRTECSSAVFTSKRHSMGVCSIHCNPHKDFIIATGSYDENIFIWDSRHMTKPLSRIEVGGGVWRLKWNPNIPDILLAACMHNGFSIIKPTIVVSYKEHSSLAYGCDWKVMKEKSDQEQSPKPSNELKCDQLVASCSFYDHSLHLWYWRTGVNL
ncbi:uncharacterized protein TRIADDRAFT_20606 [Trichoplax adhaerens]|uniref:methylated diphthine methylhydrolase n=1 Tax=Trichoplax adhaerens TaxID=10228 RepID=B3RPV9_TRIAD|nr:hypothetical protein TRIADDRAFT_20606 [Trichoplax adhaerens]EDV27709.1 hypothetical protein TRIADDRAFT_20606 [Trichoplax adhaerens]|eukprot:XP_002109543.1 hypothetical protein TRIADDRAFT_20606 [Trichoplax adhaerens]